MRKAEWMSGKYGIMVHYLPGIYSYKDCGKCMTCNEMADDFDVVKFVDEVKNMGADWIIFPFGQNSGFYWSYNAVIEKYMPNICSKRDLVFEIAVEAKRRGLKFIAYLPSEVDANTALLRAAFGWDLSADKKVFMERWTEVVRYYALKFGDLLDGWWIDGCYNSTEVDSCRTNDWTSERFDERKWFEALRAGNENRITAMNNGANRMSYVFDREEYLPGECDDLGKYPWDYNSTQKQWHTLIWLDCFWMHKKKGKIEPPRFSDEDLAAYLKKCFEKKGAVTMNIGIYENGTLAPETVKQIHNIKERISL